MHRSVFSKAPTNFTIISSLCHFTNSQPITIMPLKPKTARSEHLDESILVIFALHSMGKSHSKIANYVKVPMLIVTQIIQHALKNPNIPYRKTKRIGQSTKLNTRSQRVLLCHIERNLNDNLAALGTPSKSGYTLSRAMVWCYL